jgi:N utilization substance protein B
MRRRIAREAAFQLLFEAEYRLNEFTLDVTAEIDIFAAIHGRPTGNERLFAEHLVRGVLRERATLDHAIESAGANWSLGRMGLVEKSILRLAIFELIEPDQGGALLPVEIVIDEAIELAKIYGAVETPGFVNGVLDAIAAMRRPDGAATPQEN